MNKYDVCKEIGAHFGHYWTEGPNVHAIYNGDETFKYKTPEALLDDWVETLIHQHIASKGEGGANWENEVRFIYEDVLKRNPTGVRIYEGKRKTTYIAEAYMSDGTRHGKMIYLGRYNFIIDAIEAVWKYKNII